MSSKAMSLKGRINNYAKGRGITAQVVLQNYMFERFLDRLSNSGYRDKFVIKGGMLIAAIVATDKMVINDETLLELMSREINAFMGGKYSAQDCASQIQSRVSLYLAEQG